MKFISKLVEQITNKVPHGLLDDKNASELHEMHSKIKSTREYVLAKQVEANENVRKTKQYISRGVRPAGDKFSL